jgi:hypothetical protein
MRRYGTSDAVNSNSNPRLVKPRHTLLVRAGAFFFLERLYLPTYHIHLTDLPALDMCNIWKKPDHTGNSIRKTI